jgi:hypothetical protein
MKFWVSLVAYQLVWFAAVIGAGHGLAWPGVAAMLVYVCCQLMVSQQRRADLLLIPTALVFGLLLDGGLARSGLAVYAASWHSIVTAPPWILALWVSFALTFTQSLAYLQKRLALAALMGAIGGPLAYLSAGGGWHVVSFAAPACRGLLWLGIGWAVAAPALAWMARRWSQPGADKSDSFSEHVA